MLRYSRWCPTHALDATEAHVRAYLSSIASSTDHPAEYLDEVVLRYRPVDGGLLVLGELDAEPDAPYLRDDWTPEQDIADNPLSVPSIEDE